MVEIVAQWTDAVDDSAYYTVQINENRYVDVKCCNDNFVYIMQCEDGNEIYDDSQNTYAEKTPNSKKIINVVRAYHKQLKAQQN